MEQLNELEAAVMTKLLAGDHPALASLREQAQHIIVTERRFSGVGFVTDLAVERKVHAAPVTRPKSRLGDVLAEVNGLENGIGFILYIENGYLCALEGYTFGEPWPNSVNQATLMYISQLGRDLSGLGV